MTTTTASAITILRTSARGAHLITDGNLVAWVQGRSVREDGSLTPSGVSALANSEKTLAQWEEEEKMRELWRTDREKAKELAFQAGKEPVTVTISRDRFTDYSDKAWKVRTDRTQRLYGKLVSVYEYLPKSIVSAVLAYDKVEMTMPKWFLGKHEWLEMLKIS